MILSSTDLLLELWKLWEQSDPYMDYPHRWSDRLYLPKSNEILGMTAGLVYTSLSVCSSRLSSLCLHFILILLLTNFKYLTQPQNTCVSSTQSQHLFSIYGWSTHGLYHYNLLVTFLQRRFYSTVRA